MKRLISLIALSVFALFCFSGCSSKYDENDFIGKSSKEIIEEFGEFDCVFSSAKDGLYRNTKCGYTVKEAKKGFLQQEPEVLLFISFDENGIATECEEGYRPGG